MPQDMTRAQFVILETSNFVQQKFYNADLKAEPIDVPKFIAYAQPLIIGFDEEVRAYIASLSPEETDEAEREAIYTRHVYSVEQMCRKIDTLEMLSTQVSEHTRRFGTGADMLVMLRMFALMGAIRAEL